MASRPGLGLMAALVLTACPPGDGASSRPIELHDKVSVELCSGGRDEDADGLVDCQDDDCDLSPLCVESDCDDGLDSDADDLIDCEDMDCDGQPCCGELICDDGVDSDEDGLTDCEDDDCADAPGCTELACGDGRDKDSDGLTDCEDADCFDDALCVEWACNDGLDEDEDGLTDCEDEDCWGACYPTGVRSRVHGGSVALASSQWERHWGAGMVTGFTAVTYQRGQARSVWGTVQLLPFGVTAWSTATPTTCGWWLVSADFVNRQLRGTCFAIHTTTVHSIDRRGFALSGACPVVGSWFLPQAVFLDNDTVHTDQARVSSGWRAIWRSGTPWYQGTVSHRTTATSTRTWCNSCDHAWGSGGRETTVFRSFTLNVNSAGGTYTYVP